MVPMIRMSEVYYIAAEAIYDTDKELAKTYLKTVKQGRVLVLLTLANRVRSKTLLI